MIDDLLYRCPLCGAFDWLDKDRCVSCSATFRLTGRSAAEMNGERAPLSYWYDRTRGFDLACGPDGTIAKSRRVTLSREAASGMYHGFAGITAYHFTRARIDEGTLTLTPSSLTFAGLAARMTIPMEGILSLTIESNTLIVVGAGHGALFFDFHEESGKKWEDLLRKTLERHYEGDEIVEFYPRVRLRSGITRTPRTEAPARELRAPARRWYRKDTSLLETILKPLGKFLVRALLTVEVRGVENIPKSDPAVILPNHESFLDSVILRFLTPRTIWFMAKNSEYRGAFMKWFLRHASTFPVRRYTIDVLAVRNAVRVVSSGNLLGIFPEGERTWDGRMLPIRMGAARLVLALGVPVIPVGISGAYDLMPRWTHSIRRADVRVAIGEPLNLPKIPVSRQTASDIDAASRAIREAIERLRGGSA